MAWNAKFGARRLGPGIPKSGFWASAKEGIDQVGCVYSTSTEARHGAAMTVFKQTDRVLLVLSDG